MPGSYDPYAGLAQPATPVGQGGTVGSTLQQQTANYWALGKNALMYETKIVPGMYGQSTGPVIHGDSAAPAPPLNEHYGGTTQMTGDTGGNGTVMSYIPGAGTLGTETTLGQSMNNLLDMGANADPTKIEQLQRQLIAAGFLDPSKKGFNLGSVSGTNDPTYSAWYQTLETAIRTGTDFHAILQNRIDRDAGKKYEDLLAAKEEKARKAAARALALSQPHTVNRSATTLSDPTQAQGLLTSMLTNELGRNPTTDELSQYVTALNAAQAQNPTNTTALIDPQNGWSDKTSTTTGGLDPNQFTQNYINQNFGAEKNAVGGATGFYQAALSALGPLEGSFG